ncbi:cytokine receptor common subunit beta [Amia ocellicauda]|uniref:cytokine receptor common subunit beta n=1 Tax=Amia ocellicauda TaxID=2972642 RepID=UPI00346462AC
MPLHRSPGTRRKTPPTPAMAHLWILCTASLLTLSLPIHCTPPRAGTQPTQQMSQAMQSLRCYNDYISQIECSWNETQEAHSLAPLTLHHWNQIKNRQCVPSDPPVNRSQSVLEFRCRFNNSDLAIGILDSFLLHPLPLHPQWPSLQALLLGDNVRPRPPRNLVYQMTQEGGTVLTWDSVYPLDHSLHSTLNYQLQYRRAPQDWTEALVSKSQLALGDLVPGVNYQARVRARVREGSWSEWSPLLEWRTKDISDWGPYNLHCDFDGLDEVTCTWEVKREVTSSILFNLTYHTSPTAQEQSCCPEAVNSNSHDPLLLFRCQFPATTSSELQVHLRPAELQKEFLPNQHIKPPAPQAVSIEDKGDGLLLSWKLPVLNYEMVLDTQVRYWRDEQQEEKVETIVVNQSTSSINLQLNQLSPGASYSVQARVCVSHSGDELGYSGTWSDWSPTGHWSTPPDFSLPASCFYFLLSLSVATVAMFLFCLYRRAHTRINVWQVSIPSPLKSKVLKEIIRNSPGVRLLPQKDFDRTNISKVQVLEILQPSFNTQCSDCSWSPVEEDSGSYQRITWAGVSGTPLLLQCGDGGQGQGGERRVWNQGCPSPSLNFTGPYILCPQSSASNPDLGAPCSSYNPFSSIPSDQLGQSSNGYITDPLEMMTRSEKIPLALYGTSKMGVWPGEGSEGKLGEGCGVLGLGVLEGYVESSPSLTTGPPPLQFVTGHPISDPSSDTHSPSSLSCASPSSFSSFPGKQMADSLPDPPPAHTLCPQSIPLLPSPSSSSHPPLLNQVGDYCFLPDPSGQDWDSAHPPGDLLPPTGSKDKPGLGKAIDDDPYIRPNQPV